MTLNPVSHNSLQVPPSSPAVDSLRSSTASQLVQVRDQLVKEVLPLDPSRVTLPQAPILTRKEIYSKISKMICQVETDHGKATGFNVGGNLIAVPYHVLSFDRVNMDGGEIRYKARPIRCVYDGVVYSAEAVFANDNSATLDCAIYRVKDVDFLKLDELLLYEGEIKAGEEVYFAGFPLTQTAPTFHSGTISSISDDDFSSFTIDGTVVPGNSGGPVFILDNGVLKLAGVIFHQIADFSPEDRETIMILEHLAQNPSGAVINHDVSYITAQGRKQVRVTDMEAIVLAIGLIKRNLSTGIGRAFNAKYLVSLLQNEPFPTPPESLRTLGMDVGRKDRQTKIYHVNNTDYYTHCDGHEAKHLKNSRKKMKPRDFLAMTLGENSPATFYAHAAQNYNALLEQAIKRWADAGAPQPSHHTFDHPIGADQGHETSTVEIYYGGPLGSHIRPKQIE